MSKFTFICEDEPMPFATSVDAKRTVQFNSDSLGTIIEEFENFLRGCGFHFRGQLDFIDEEDLVYVSEDSKIELTQYGAAQPTFDFSEIPQNNWPFETKPNVSDR